VTIADPVHPARLSRDGGPSSFQENTMAIPDPVRTNFDTLLRAADDGNLALMECLDAATRETRYVLCAVGRDGGDYVFTPFSQAATPMTPICRRIPTILPALSRRPKMGAHHDDGR